MSDSVKIWDLQILRIIHPIKGEKTFYGMDLLLPIFTRKKISSRIVESRKKHTLVRFWEYSDFVLSYQFI